VRVCQGLVECVLKCICVITHVRMHDSPVCLCNQESDSVEQQRLDRETLYEALIDSVIRLLLHVQDMLAQRSCAHDSLSADDVSAPSQGMSGGVSAGSLGHGGGGSNQNRTAMEGLMEGTDGELDTNLWGAGNVLVRLSSVVGDHLKRSGGGGPTARKSCALLTLLGRMSSWSDAVHWDSLLDQV
jgi:hypothetical protein